MACVAAGALAFAASGVSAQEGPSATAVVRASATILSPVALQAPSSLSLVDAAGALALEGAVEVRSPAPHVVSANARAWSPRSGTGFGAVQAGAHGAAPRRVQVEIPPAADGEPVRVTYVVAVIL